MLAEATEQIEGGLGGPLVPEAQTRATAKWLGQYREQLAEAQGTRPPGLREEGPGSRGAAHRRDERSRPSQRHGGSPSRPRAPDEAERQQGADRGCAPGREPGDRAGQGRKSGAIAHRPKARKSRMVDGASDAAFAGWRAQ